MHAAGVAEPAPVVLKADKTHLDTLATDELESVVDSVLNWFSDWTRPAGDWSRWGGLDRLCEFSHPDHPLRTISQGIVQELALSGIDECKQETLLNAYARRCSVLSVDEDGFIPETWDCLDLKSLTVTNDTFMDDVAFPLRSLLASQGNLRELVMDCRVDSCTIGFMEAVAEYGARLQRLRISGVDLRHREERYSLALTRMLKATGSELVSLQVPFFSLCGPDVSELFDIKVIAGLCPYLKEIDVGDVDPANGREFLADQVGLFCAYGGRLEGIGSTICEDVPEEFLRRIKEECPNAAVNVERSWSAESNIADILAGQIRHLTIERGCELSASDIRAFDHCVNVKSLVIEQKHTAAFFATPKPTLAELDLRHPGRVCDFEDVSLVAENTGGLTEITLGGPRFSRRTLAQIACSNRGLERVHVRVWSADADRIGDFYSTYMVDLVEVFAGCDSLQQLSLKPMREHRKEVEDGGRVAAVEGGCFRMRGRGVVVHVGDVEYLR